MNLTVRWSVSSRALRHSRFSTPSAIWYVRRRGHRGAGCAHARRPMPSSILTLGSDVFFLQDRNARHYFPGLYQEHCLVQERERSDSSVLIIDAQEDKATSSVLPANIRKLSNATDAVDARDAEDAVAGTARKRRKTQRALEADVGSMRNTRRKTAANANKENLPQRTDRSGRVAPTEAAGQRGQGTKGTKGTEGTKGTKGTREKKTQDWATPSAANRTQLAQGLNPYNSKFWNLWSRSRWWQLRPYVYGMTIS